MVQAFPLSQGEACEGLRSIFFHLLPPSAFPFPTKHSHCPYLSVSIAMGRALIHLAKARHEASIKL